MTAQSTGTRHRRLARAAWAARTGATAEAPPVRIVHLGVGAFARAHQAWYTARVDDAGEWGIAAFTGRNPEAARLLSPQGGLYTVLERGADGDAAEVVASIVEVVDGADVDRLCALLATPSTAIVTITVTESGYRLRADGLPDLADPVLSEDVALLRMAVHRDATPETPAPRSALARLVLGLAARRTARAGGIAIVPCDNMPDNGDFVRSGVLALAADVDAGLADWIRSEVSFVSTTVDRITPRTTAEDVAVAAELSGWDDAAPVVTEPFRDWVLCGRFPGGRPPWERAGARFVDDIEPFERRKLWLLNGAHSLLAYEGLRRGYRTVAEAIADGGLRDRVQLLWAEAARHLPEDLDVPAYTAALLTRFENSRIAHHLSQISGEAVTKLRVRFVPVARLEREAGRSAEAAAEAFGAWIALVLRGHDLVDAHGESVHEAASTADPVGALVALVDAGLAGDASFLDRVRAASA